MGLVIHTVPGAQSTPLVQGRFLAERSLETDGKGWYFKIHTAPILWKERQRGLDLDRL